MTSLRPASAAGCAGASSSLRATLHRATPRQARPATTLPADVSGLQPSHWPTSVRIHLRVESPVSHAAVAALLPKGFSNRIPPDSAAHETFAPGFLARTPAGRIRPAAAWHRNETARRLK